nr:diguanylate cyclase [uncultured Anaeromusa sp.]
MSKKFWQLPGRMWQKLSLRKKLGLVFAVLTVVPLLMTTFFTWQSYGKAMRETVVERNRQLAEQIGSDLEWVFAEKMRLLRMMAKTAAVRSMDAERQNEALRQMVLQYPDIQLAVVADAQGRQVARWDGQMEQSQHISYWDRSYYTEVLKTGTTAVSDVLMAKSTQKMGIVVAEPILRDERIEGVLIVNIELRSLVSRIGATTVGDSGYAYVVNRYGRMIMHPDLGLIAEGVDASALRPVQEVLAEHNGSLEYEDAKGTALLASYRFVPTTRMGVVVQQPLQEAMEPVAVLKWVVLVIALLSSALAAVGALELARTMAMPLIRISEATRRLAAGDLSFRLPVTSKDEIGQLAANFNDMTEQLLHRDEALSHIQGELERKVALRTRELQALNEELRRISRADGLTGLANRRYFDEFLQREWLRSRRKQECMALIMIDVDEFKRYNDYYGHLRGDDCLRRIGVALVQTVKRSSDLVARYGGEEFAVVLPATTEEGALELAGQIQQAVAAACMRHERSHNGEFITVSMGLAAFIPQGDDTYKELVAVADQALYQAKRQGRNCICIGSH